VAGAVAAADAAHHRSRPGRPGERPTARARYGAAVLVLLALAGAAVAVALGTYGRTHTPTGGTIETFGFPTMISMKAWFTTAAAGLALVQAGSALVMWGRAPGIRTSPAWVPGLHRWSGTVAFLAALPVAYHCLWSLGYQVNGTRQAVHSFLGCAFFGVLTTKLLALRVDGLPRWALPVLGGVLFTSLVAVWFTSSLWFFTNVAFPY
jgi:hypothetical protein